MVDTNDTDDEATDSAVKSDDTSASTADESTVEAEAATKTSASRSKRRAWIGKGGEILFTAVVTAVLTVATTLYVQRDTAPKLSIDYAWCLTKMHPYKLQSQDSKKKPTEPIEDQFISFVVDLKSQSLVPHNAYIISLKSSQKNAYTYNPDLVGYIGRMVIENTGKTTATNVRIGISYLFPVTFAIKVSPNVRATLVPYDPKEAAKDDSYWPYRNEIQIDDLPPGQKAFVTLSWALTSADVSKQGEVPQSTMYYVPEIIFFSSHETGGQVRSFLPYMDIVDIQSKAMSETMPPGFKTPIDIKKPPVQMNAKLLSEEEAQQILTFQFKGPAPENPSAPVELR